MGNRLCLPNAKLSKIRVQTAKMGNHFYYLKLKIKEDGYKKYCLDHLANNCWSTKIARKNDLPKKTSN